MAATFRLQIVTPQETILDTEVEMVVLRTTEGDMGILANHIPLVAELAIGEMKIKSEGKDEIYYVSGGFLEVSREKTLVLADEAISLENLDVERARRDAEIAKQKLLKLKEEKDIASMEKTLQEALTKVKIVERHM